MRRAFPYLVLAMAIAAGIVVLVITRLDQEPAAVPPVKLAAAKCEEPQTTRDFQQFWIKFQAAVEGRDKPELLSMMRVCGFDWFVGRQTEELRRPLAFALDDVVPLGLSLPFGVQPPIQRGRSGSGFLFQSEEDFVANYEVIFSKRMTLRILNDKPVNIGDGVYKIEWRDDGLNSLSFDCLDDGCKFKGLQWEP